MKKRDNHNTVDVKVGIFLKQWVVNVYGSEVIKLGKDSNLWSIIKQNLELLPSDYHPLKEMEKDEYITFVLLRNGGDTLIYDEVKNREIQPNMIYRCHLSERGSNIIQRFLKKQFKNTFHNYMRGAMNNNAELSITEAITEFLQDSCQPVIDNKIISTLSKDWYRFRLKYPDEYKIPIFF